MKRVFADPIWLLRMPTERIFADEMLFCACTKKQAQRPKQREIKAFFIGVLRLSVLPVAPKSIRKATVHENISDTQNDVIL